MVDGIVPDATEFVRHASPLWRAFADLIIDAVGDAEVCLVGHSGAGAILPVVASDLPRKPAAIVFVDAVLPGRGPYRCEDTFYGTVSAKSVDGLLPRWSSWWPEETMTDLLPDEGLRKKALADQPQVPLSYYDDAIPMPRWADWPCGYVRLSAAYDAERRQAVGRGWPTVAIDATHLAVVTHPADVLAAIDAVVGQL